MTAAAFNDVDYYTSTTVERERKAAASKDKSTVSHDDFLKLLITQLTHQDPLKPMEDIDFTAQLAQLQALEEQINLNNSFKAMRIDSQLQAASGMIGLYVTGDDPYGNPAEGLVKTTLVEDSTVYLVLDSGRKIGVSDIRTTQSTVSDSNLLASAASLVGMFVHGVATDGETVAGGIVSKAILDSNGDVALQLYGGKIVPMKNILELRIPTDDEFWYYLPDNIREQAEEARERVDQAVTIKVLVNGKFEQKTGVVREAILEGDSVKLVFHDDTKFTLSDIVSYRPPTDDDLRAAANTYVGKFCEGTDVDGNPVSGIVVASAWPAVTDPMIFTLQDGTRIHLGDTTTLRTATAEELERYAPTPPDGGGDGTGDGDGDGDGDDGTIGDGD
jgi:flagellar basal-body rod modification protein FlgD